MQEQLSQWKSLKKSWWSVVPEHIEMATNFMLSMMDYLIIYVEDKIPKGADKKATVLLYLGLIYDVIAPEILPLWAVPFSGIIKQCILYCTLSVLVDYAVNKCKITTKLTAV